MKRGGNKRAGSGGGSSDGRGGGVMVGWAAVGGADRIMEASAPA